MDEFTEEELMRRSEQYVRIRTDNNQAAREALTRMGIRALSQASDCLYVRERLDSTPSMAAAIVNAGIGLRELSVNSVSLEDYYLSVTGGKHNG